MKQRISQLGEKHPDYNLHERDRPFGDQMRAYFIYFVTTTDNIRNANSSYFPRGSAFGPDRLSNCFLDYFDKLFEISIKNQGFRSYTLRLLSEIFGRSISLDDYAKFKEELINNNISIDDIFTIAKALGKIMQQEEDYLRQQIEIVKKEFRKKVLTFVDENRTGLDTSIVLSIESNLERLITVKFSIMGTSYYSGGVLSFGDHDHIFGNRISPILLNSREESLLHSTISHELLHEISGMGLELRSLNGSQEMLPHIYKSGLAGDQLASGRWLNEATTVMLNNILGYKEESYPKESKLLSVLILKGLDRNLIWNAYFENWERDSEGNKLNPANSHFRKLVDAINKLLEQIYGVKDSWIRLSRSMKDF